jgi:L-cystine transport system permease protein
MDLDYGFLQQTFLLVLMAVPMTLKLTAVAFLAAVLPAFAIAWLRLHTAGIWRRLATAYVTFVRGTPIVLQILLVYSLLPSLLKAGADYLQSDTDVFAWDPIIYAYAVFALNTTALLSEVFRSALANVAAGQMEAALCAGLTKPQAYRCIILPQALVSALPNICNLVVNLIKGTSLAFLMTVKDMTAVARVAASYGYDYIEAYMDVFAGYVIVCTVIQLLFDYAEAHVGRYRLGRQV